MTWPRAAVARQALKRFSQPGLRPRIVLTPACVQAPKLLSGSELSLGYSQHSQLSLGDSQLDHLPCGLHAADAQLSWSDTRPAVDALAWSQLSDDSVYSQELPKATLIASLFCERESQLERPVSPDCLKLDVPQAMPVDDRPLVVDPRWLNSWGNHD